MKCIAQFKSFTGDVYYYQHHSSSCNCLMTFAIYLPPQAKHRKVPVVYWLSGLTCNHENFISKAGAQRLACYYGLALIMPDTSPRNIHLNVDLQQTDLGYGAGFYINATQSPWAQHFKLYDYIVHELPAYCAENFSINANRTAIMGHSMGGHGAMMIALRNPDQYQSVSAFAPICSPMDCPWGQKAFSHYLGNNKTTWAAYDSCELIKKTQTKIPLLVEQGMADTFLQAQLSTTLLEQTCQRYNHPLTLNWREGYDHSYYFIASFIEDHLDYHASILL